MKKCFKLLICVIIAVITSIYLFGCSKDTKLKKYTAYAISSTGDIEGEGGNSGSNGLMYYSYFGEKLTEPKEKNRTITFLGNEYEAEYESLSIGSIFDLQSCLTYTTKDKDIFDLDSSGNVINFNSSLQKEYYIKEYSCSEEESALIISKAIDAATKIAEETFGADIIAEFTASVGKNKIDDNVIMVGFSPKYEPGCGYKQIRRITIELTLDYELLFLESVNVRNFIGKTVPKDFGLDKIREILKEMKTDGKSKVELACDVLDNESKQFYIFPMGDGRLAAMTSIVVNNNLNDTIRVIIPIE